MGDHKMSSEALKERLDRAEAALRVSEEKYRTLIENQPDLVCRWLPDTTLTFVNQAYCDFFRKTRDELLGKSWLSFIPEAPRENVRRKYARLALHPVVLESEHPAVAADGTPRWQNWRDVPIFDPSGRLIEFQSVGRDITERKQAEEELRGKATLFKALFDNHAAVKLILDAHSGDIIDANQAAVDFYGWSRDTLLKMKIQDINILPPEEVKKKIEMARAEERVRFEFQHRRADGSIRNVEVYVGRIDFKGKEVLHSIIHDITERKRVEAERNRLTKAIEHAGEIVLITDPDGAVQYVNPAFETITGFRREEAIGRNPRMLKSGEQDRAFYRNLWKTITSGRTWKGHMVNRRKDGTLYTEETSISPVRDNSGRIVNYVAVKRDVTEQLRAIEKNIRLTEQLHQAQKMESIGVLAGGVAHDFNNLLTTILGNVDLALGEVTKADPLYEYLLEIKMAAEKAADLTRRLLSFSRRETRVPELLDLNGQIGEMQKMLMRLFREDIELVVIPGSGLWEVYMDPSQMDQVIMNLAVNARDAMPDGGTLTIETANVELDPAHFREHGVENASGPYVMLAVTDTGIGMNEETRQKMFDPFYTTKERGTGTGLGLATVYGVIKQNGGFI